ncbi:BTB/POZ and MATH domain-containing protein 2-like [Miscanthus floridulus]|uniref:BTB/POZ and MATH domain-containing protein 2-like n=1 Tax=Miscanthus floridulus TaxID=154761 RepID=UPI00345917D0
MISCVPDSFWIWKRPRGGVTTTSTTVELETTTSTCTTETVRRKHVFVVQGYSSLLSRVGVGSFVRSATFEVGGYDWAVRYFPRGDSKHGAAKSGCASAFAVILTPGAEARASCDLTLVSQRLGVPNHVHRTEPWFLRHGGGGSDLAPCLGSSTFVKTSKLEELPSPYVHDDCLRIECVITVFKFKKARRSPAAAAPTPTLSQDLVRLLETKEGADVSFKVEGEVFAAHAIVLAMRSPVFKAQLYGPMKETTGEHRDISIVDMQADVFRALLRFIYTDAVLPGLDDDDLGRDGGSKEFVKHLLVAADRYDVRGLKFVCEKSVCESLTIATVASMFALADQHNCSMLQDACVDFITGSDTLADVMASEGYCQLKSLCPGVMIDLFEKATKWSRKNHHA